MTLHCDIHHERIAELRRCDPMRRLAVFGTALRNDRVRLHSSFDAAMEARGA